MHQGHTTEEQSDIHIALYDRHISALLPYLARLMTSHQDVENVLFDVFAAALTSQAFTRLTHEQQRAWLYRVARNKAIDHYRHHTALTIVPLDETRDSQDEEPTPEQRFLRQERYTFLREAIAQLTPSNNNSSIYAIKRICAWSRSRPTYRNQMGRCARCWRALSSSYEHSTNARRKEADHEAI